MSTPRPKKDKKMTAEQQAEFLQQLATVLTPGALDFIQQLQKTFGFETDATGSPTLVVNSQLCLRGNDKDGKPLSVGHAIYYRGTAPGYPRIISRIPIKDGIAVGPMQLEIHNNPKGKLGVLIAENIQPAAPITSSIENA